MTSFWYCSSEGCSILKLSFHRMQKSTSKRKSKHECQILISILFCFRHIYFYSTLCRYIITMVFFLLRPGTGLRPCLTVILLIFAVNFGFGTDNIVSAPHNEGNNSFVGTRPLFPSAFYVSFLNDLQTIDEGRPFWVPSEAEFNASRVPQDSILLNNDILAFYGHPNSKTMGILGRYPKQELKDKLDVLAAEYQELGGRNIVKAFYIIFGTVWPEGAIGIIGESLLKEWIDFALENDLLVFIDHQIGRHTPEDSIRRMLPWLAYPNVHLALDPEWRTTRPMREIGSVSADEINRVQGIMEDYIIENGIPGERLLVIHQFNYRMITNRENVRSDFSRVRLVHNASGIGTPQQKRALYEFTSRATNMPVNGFKLWFDFGIPGHTDRPLLSPREVLGLRPRPYVVMYQ